MLSLLFAASLFVTQAPDTAHVVLVATTDVHGRATAWDYLAERAAPGGLTRVATVVDSLRRRFPGQVVVLDAGDMLQGNAFAAYQARQGRRQPNPIVEAMNLVGYDAATPGNHDFDWGVPELERALADAAFPYVSANLFRVLVWDGDRLRGKIRVERIEAAAGRTFADMRRSSDLVVALAHSGVAGPSSYDTTGVGAEDVAGSFATMKARPDVVIVGHSHDEIRDSTLGEVRYVQPKPYAASVAVVHVDMVRPRGREWQVGRIRSELISTAEVTPSAVVEQRLRPAHDAVRAWVGEAIGMAIAPMPAATGRAMITPVVDWMLDVQRRRAGATLAAGPVFDLRAGFPGDTIHRRDLLRLYPYENTLREDLRRTAQGLPRAQCPILPGGRRGQDLDQRLDAGVRLRPGARRAVRHRPPAADRQPDPEPRRRRPTGRAIGQLHDGAQQSPSERRGGLLDGGARTGGLRSRGMDPGAVGGRPRTAQARPASRSPIELADRA
jgi:2',3'-cyclic-nucleotide 2'-phosphodiesterase/3'-nucleotidase